jgi:rhodanese-related sulfurtransferase
MNRRSVVSSIIGIATILLGKGQPKAAESEPKFGTLRPAQLAKMLQHKDFFFVNVHVPYEGEIDNTDAEIPFDKIVENLGKFPNDRAAKIVLYCRSGRMSAIAARDLTRLGYTNVSHLSGGMRDWQASGYRIRK